MIIKPKIRGFICTTAHPRGCHESVAAQIAFVKAQGSFSGPRNVLVIGASTGYGLASRIVAAFGAGAKTLGVFFEKEADDKRTASAGWYNSAAFETIAHGNKLYAKSINGDAFSKEIKEKTKIADPFATETEVKQKDNIQNAELVKDPDAELKDELRKQYPSEEEWQIIARIKESRGQA